jgi:uncharacterized membrane protein
MLVVVLSNETNAYEASRALNQLDTEGSIAIHAESVVTKNSDGTVAMKQADGDFPILTLNGTAIGSLIGLLGGPAGVALGSLAGATAGSMSDLFVAGVDADFLDEVSDTLTPGKSAVVADVSEEWVTPVDTKMEALGGVVFRTTRRNFEEDQRQKDVTEMRSEIDQLKTEHARAKADRKARLQAKIDELNTKLQGKLDQAKQRSDQMKKETDAKVQALQKKASKAQGDAKTAIDARVTEIRQRYEQSAARLKNLVA